MCMKKFMFRVTVMIALEVTKQYDGQIYFITMYMYKILTMVKYLLFTFTMSFINIIVILSLKCYKGGMFLCSMIYPTYLYLKCIDIY